MSDTETDNQMFLIMRVFCKDDPKFVCICLGLKQLRDVVNNKLNDDKHEHHCNADKDFYMIMKINPSQVYNIDYCSASCDGPDDTFMYGYLNVMTKIINRKDFDVNSDYLCIVEDSEDDE